MSILLLFVVLVTAAILGHGFLRGRQSERALQNAGIGEDRPGCSSCLYPLGGWSGPRCPECGTDVTEAGVRVQSERRLRRRLAIAALLCLWIGLPGLGALAGFLVAAEDESVTCDAQSERDPGVRVLLTSEHAWSRIPPRSRRAASVELFDLADASGTLAIHNGRPTGMQGVRSATISFAATSPPTKSEIEDRLRRGLSEVTGGRLSPENLDVHAAAMAVPVHATLKLDIGTGATRPAVGPPFVNGGWGMVRAGPDALRQLLAMGGTLAALAVLLVFALRAVRRRTSPGIRPCTPNEWACAP